MAALAVKVFSLTVKTFSKPLANSFQAAMLSHPRVRAHAIQSAQYLHRINVRMTRFTEDAEGRVFIGTLNEEKALKLASKFFSELFIYMVAGGLVYYEYDRSVAKDEKKKRDKEKRRGEKDLLLARLERRQEELWRRIEEIEQRKESRRWFGL